jgi:Asp-tRNA(Asn)/Glu-tRNA(Gln) amidotransferase C subunit
MSGHRDHTVLQRPSLETVRAMASGIGLTIDEERVPVVQTVLAELLGLAATLDQFDLEGIEPDAGDPRTGWEESR